MESREHTDAPFNLAVVADPRVMTPAELNVVLDRMVSRYVGLREIRLVSAGGPAEDWAADRGYVVLPVMGDHPVKAVCDIVAQADAVMVVGDPAPYRLLVWLAAQAGIPCQVVRRCPGWARDFRPASNLPD